MSKSEGYGFRELDALFSKTDSLLQAPASGDKPVIAAWGLMNAGKSYLLNMLTEHFDEEYFRTRDVRETAELKTVEMQDYIFLDTPGLDANSTDDQVALEGAARADVVLFVHQPQGELEKIEVDLLRQLKSSFGELAGHNIILVLSKSDKESAEKINAIQQRVLEQCHNELGFTPCCFQVSGTRFHNGIKQNKDGLIHASHVQELKQHLATLVIDSHSVAQVRQRQAIDTLLSELAHAEQHLLQKQAKVKQKLLEGFTPFTNAMTAFRISMATNAKKFREI